MAYSDGRERNYLTDPLQQIALFGGQGSQTADQNALATAIDMQRAGSARDEILAQTGWLQRKDGKWRYEIDDRPAELIQGGIVPGKSSTKNLLINVLNHPELYKAYPHIGQTEVRFERGRDAKRLDAFGMQQGNTIWMDADYVYHNPRGFLDTLLHEVQHKIQEDDPLTYGDMASPYSRRPGEVESRNVERRVLMSPEQRRMTPPWLTEDTPEDKQAWPRVPAAAWTR